MRENNQSRMSDDVADAGVKAAKAADAVKKAVEGGKVMTGSAAGPHGAALALAWEHREALFYLIGLASLLSLLIVSAAVSMPIVLVRKVVGIFTPPDPGVTVHSSYADITAQLADIVGEARREAYMRVAETIRVGGYDKELSEEALTDETGTGADYDAAYIMAIYSLCRNPEAVNEEDMYDLLRARKARLYPVTEQAGTKERYKSTAYMTYRQVNVEVIVRMIRTGVINGTVQYRYETASKTYYEPAGTVYSDEPAKIPAFSAISVTVPVRQGGVIRGGRTETYYVPAGQRDFIPDTEAIRYVACTIRPLDMQAVLEAFPIDPDAEYGESGHTNGEVARNMADNAMRAMGYTPAGFDVTVDEASLRTLLDSLKTSPQRKALAQAALSLVGKVPYFWGGKSPAGWNDEWGRPRKVTSAGSPETGTVRPFGLDCSGYTDWVYRTALGTGIGSWTGAQNDNSIPIRDADLRPGDLGLLIRKNDYNHVMIFIGRNEEGQKIWAECAGGTGVRCGTVRNDYIYEPRRPMGIDFGD